jgi:hypothetical protein
MFRTFVIAFCGIAFMCTSCRHHGKLLGPKRQVTAAFYHWKTRVALSHEDSTMLRETGCKKLYVNFFDVVKNEDTTTFKYPAIPGSQTSNLDLLPKNIEIVPVVYITNDAVKNMDSSNIPYIAEKFWKKMNRLIVWSEIAPVKEIQIDCDWTKNSRAKYFYLLSQIKEKSKIPVLSATIRLYQYKYFKKTGVPPVDKGVLMFYHMNAVQIGSTKDLILDVEEGKKYMIKEKYPLPLDFALPLFSEMMIWNYWECKFYSPATFKRLMADSALQKVDTAANWYRVRKQVDLGKNELIWGYETIKMEEAKIDDLRKAADLLSDHANSDSFNVIFFHLDKVANSSYTSHEVKDLVSRFD